MIIIIIIINISTFRAVMTEILRLCTHCQVSHFNLKQSQVSHFNLKPQTEKIFAFSSQADFCKVSVDPLMVVFKVLWNVALGTIDNQAYDGFHFPFSQFGRHLHVHCLKWIFAIKFIRHDFLCSVEILLRAYPCNMVSSSETPR